MKNTWKINFFCSMMSIFTTGIYSFGCDSESSPLSSQAESDFYGKFLISSSKFSPTALLPLEEFDTVSDNSPLRKINRQCIEDSRHYVKALWNQSEWALSMYHASGRLSIDESTNFLIAGHLGNNVHQDPGLFDRCVATSSPSGRIKGQYCSILLSAQPLIEHADHGSLLNEPKVSSAERQLNISWRVNAPESIIGFCLPSSCSAIDLQTAVAHTIGRTTFRTKNKNGTVKVQSIVTSSHDRFCHSEIKIQDQQVLDTTCIAFLVVICFIGLLILISTLHECWMRTKLGPRQNIQKILDDGNVLPIRILHCFSALRNVKYLITTDSSSDDIQCLHGIRTLSFFLIILGHMGGEMFFQDRLYNYDATMQFHTSWYGQPATNLLSVLVDNFFLMGGLLVCSSLLKDFDRGLFSLRRFYLHRYLRLTPLYAVILFFVTTFESRFGSGPNWISPLHRSGDCRSYWWSHLLYINNKASFFSLCMGETWYLSTEMQLFIFSPLVVYLLWRWPKRAGPIFIALLLAASFSYSTVIYIAWNLPPTVMPTRILEWKKNFDNFFQSYYINPIARCPPYLIGIILGWILHKTKNSKILFKKPTLVIGWILSFIVQIAVLYGPFPFLDEETTPVIHPFFRVIYGVFHRTIWSIATAWIIFACAKGYGGILNDLLSSRIFCFFAKICFSGYLVHYNLIIHYVSQLRIPFYYTSIQLLVAYFGILVLTLCISALLTISIEIPFRNLERCFLSKTLKISSWKNQNHPLQNPGEKSTKTQ